MFLWRSSSVLVETCLRNFWSPKMILRFAHRATREFQFKLSVDTSSCWTTFSGHGEVNDFLNLRLNSQIKIHRLKKFRKTFQTKSKVLMQQLSLDTSSHSHTNSIRLLEKPSLRIRNPLSSHAVPPNPFPSVLCKPSLFASFQEWKEILSTPLTTSRDRLSFRRLSRWEVCKLNQ